MTTTMTDEYIINDLKQAYKQGYSHLIIHSRRQDIGIQKCERGVSLGYLTHKEINIDSQETHWHYYWTDKAKTEFSAI